MGDITWPVYSIGEKVKVFDNRFYKDDVSTPISVTMRPAVIVDIREDEESHRILFDVLFDGELFPRKNYLIYSLQKIN